MSVSTAGRVQLAIALVFFGTSVRLVARDAIDRRIDAMTPEQRIGQLLMVSCDSTSVDPALRTMLTRWHVGGAVFYRFNIQSAQQLRWLTKEVRRLSAGGPEPFLAVDEEGARTVTAASYGILQVLYSTAVGPPYRWSVPDPAGDGQTQSPLYLLDTDEALMVKHGGSVFIGSAEDVQRYWDAYPTTPVDFPTAEDFFDSFKHPLGAYTGGGIANYGTNVIDRYQYNWTPFDPNPIFQ